MSDVTDINMLVLLIVSTNLSSLLAETVDKCLWMRPVAALLVYSLFNSSAVCQSASSQQSTLLYWDSWCSGQTETHPDILLSAAVFLIRLMTPRASSHTSVTLSSCFICPYPSLCPRRYIPMMHIQKHHR